MKKKLAIVLAVIMCVSVLFTSCGKADISLSPLKDSDGTSYKGLDWFSTIEDVTKHFSISSKEDLTKEDTFYQFVVNTNVKELGADADITFSFITQKENENEKYLKDKKSGLTGIKFDFYFKTLKDVQAFEEKFMKVYAQIQETNELFAKIDYEKESGRISLNSNEAYDCNGVSIKDSFWFDISDYSQIEDKERGYDYSSTIELGFNVAGSR